MMLYAARAKRAGFTLIEIMIVIAIIAILAAIAIPNIRQARFEANLQACGRNCKTIGDAIMMAKTRMSDLQLLTILRSPGWVQSGSSSSVVFRLVDAGYLDKEPRCRARGNTLWSSYDIAYNCNGTWFRDVTSYSTGAGQTRICPGFAVFCNGFHYDARGGVWRPIWEENIGVWNLKV